MVLPRTSARWTSRVFNQSIESSRTTVRGRSWRITQRRSYASGGDHGSHGTHQSGFLSGDLPWAIGSAMVTIPSLWYLSQPQIERFTGKGKGHGHEGGEHEEHDEEGKHGGADEEGGDNEADEGKEEGQGGAGEEGGEGGEGGGDAESGEELKQPEEGSGEGEQDQEKSDDDDNGPGETRTVPASPNDKRADSKTQVDSGNEVEGVQFKGATTGPEKGQTDNRFKIPDAKGGNKKRIVSDYGQRQGQAANPEEDPGSGDTGASAKAVDDPKMRSTSGKQEGLSNTDTKHSHDMVNDPEKSKKGEGSPETAKLKGTVQPGRPQAENKEKRAEQRDQ